MATLRLEELSAATAVAANSLTLRPGQEQFLAPASFVIADVMPNPSTTWSRVVLDDEDTVVGFVRGNFDPDAPRDEFRSAIWRINVDATRQGEGIGTFAVHALADEARARGFDRITTIWEPGDASPEQFFTGVGFTVVGETEFGERIGAMQL